MPYETLYRRARPMTFDAVRGQEVVVRSLRNQIRTNRISHAYLFSGVRGTGKTSVARIFARAINCENPSGGNPCNECPTCKAILAGRSTNVIEIDAAANGRIENIRDIESLISRRPVQGNYFVFIIDETQEMKPGAVNAFLKTLEEPPAWVVFILATTSLKNLPQTIMSRCQEYDFRRIGNDVIADQMRRLLKKDGIAAEQKALDYIAAKSEGSMRDALSILDRAVAFSGEETVSYDKVIRSAGEADISRYADIAEALIDRNGGRAVRIFREILLSGVGAEQFRTELLRYLRNLLMAGEAMTEEITADAEQTERMETLSGRISGQDLGDLIGHFSEAFAQAAYSQSDRVLTETALIGAARLPDRRDRGKALSQRLSAIEERIAKADSRG